MKKQISQAAIAAQDHDMIPYYSNMRATIKNGTNATSGLLLENKNDFNDKNIIGIWLRVNADASDIKTSKEGNLLIIKAWAEQTFFTFQEGNTILLDQMPLTNFIPPVGQTYVKVWIPKFSPSTSKFTFSNTTLTDTVDRDIEFGFIHDEL